MDGSGWGSSVQHQVSIDFGAGTMSLDGGAAQAFTPATFLTTLNTTLGANGSASFHIQWLASDSGNNYYTVAFTCDPDDPSVDESAIVLPATTPTISFNTYPTPVAVTTDATTTVNF